MPSETRQMAEQAQRGEDPVEYGGGSSPFVGILLVFLGIAALVVVWALTR